MSELGPGIDLNVILLPDENTTQRLIGLSEQVANQVQVKYKLDGKYRPPHLSLYSAAYPLHNLTRISLVLEQLSALAKGVEVELRGYSVFSGYLFYDALRSRRLMELHESVVDALNPLREGLISEDQKRLLGLTKKQEDAILKYGYVSVKDTFIPHVTLARLSDPNQAEQATNFLPGGLTFTPKSLSLVPFDLEDRLKKPVATYNLTGI